MSAALVPEPAGRVRRWLRRNLFRTPVDTAITVVAGAVAAYVLFRIARFVFVTGRWEIIDVNLKLLMVGRFPNNHLLRVSVSIVVAVTVAGLLAGVVARRRANVPGAPPPLRGARRWADLASRFWPVVLVSVLLLALTNTVGPWLLAGCTVLGAVAGRVVGARLPLALHPVVAVGAVVTPFVLVWYLADALGWDQWGGLMLNIFLAVVSLILCFPLGVLLALGRRSSLPLISGLCTAFIEIVRGAPLFVLLLMANVALGFFVPQELAPGKVVRAIVVFTVFTAAYVAEVVRGGLQSLPATQEEAGRALGLSPTRITFLVVLPQALRNVIPALVGQFISLFKDTTLAGAAMGVFEVLQVAEAITQQGPFAGQGLLPETLAFVGLLFWAGSYTLSRESQRIEKRLGVGVR